MVEHKKKFLDFWVVRLEQWHIGVCMETQIIWKAYIINENMNITEKLLLSILNYY